MILWNFIIRLVMETTIELSFAVLLNLKYGSSDSKLTGAVVNYGSAILFALILVVAPTLILYFYCKNFE